MSKSAIERRVEKVVFRSKTKNIIDSDGEANDNSKTLKFG